MSRDNTDVSKDVRTNCLWPFKGEELLNREPNVRVCGAVDSPTAALTASEQSKVSVRGSAL